MTYQITRVTFGMREQESVLLSDFWKREGYQQLDTSLQQENSDGSVSIVRDGKILTTISKPVFTPYDIVKNAGGETRVRHTVDGIRVSKEAGEASFVRKSAHATFQMTVAEEILFGLGSHEEGYPCINGQRVHLFQENMRIAVPIFVSNKGYAVFIDNGSYQIFDQTSPGQLQITIDSTDCVDMYVVLGDFDAICAAFRALLGETPMLPKWAAGYAQSKERYQTQEELVEVVSEYRRRGVPLDLIVQDWLYWRPGLWGEKVLDRERYFDFAGTIDKLHEMGAHLMVSIWPNMSGDGENQQEFREAGLLLEDGSVYDAFSEAGRDLYWKQAKEGLFQYGVDAWWCDSSEPYDAVWGGNERLPKEESVQKSVAEFKKYVDDAQINLYSFYHSKGIFEHQRKESKKRVCNLTRSGYAGQHRYATIAWSGDISASWETLHKQVHILQNYVATGEAYWNSDIGAFFVRTCDQWFWKGQFPQGCEDPAYRELYTRWLQFAGFTPLMRSHGTDTPREIWRFGESGETYYDAIEAAIRLRYRLLPFFYSVHAMVTREGKMPVKPMALAFPQDAKAAAYFDQFVYGDVLLICPVTQAGQTQMEVYLPDTGLWYDFYTNEAYVGGKSYTMPLSMEHIPVFVKEGAVIPTMEVQQYADEKPQAPYHLLVYGKAEGSFTIYDDAGDGYDYEKGAYCLTHIMHGTCSTSAGEQEESGAYTVLSEGEKLYVSREGDSQFARELTWEQIG